METLAVKEPVVHDYNHLKFRLTHQATWSFVVLQVHGGESTLEGKDCVHAYEINSTKQHVISDSGMHVVLQKLGLILRDKFVGLHRACSAIQ